MKFVAKIILGTIAFCALALAFGWVTMLLWNWLMPGIFGLKMITYWEAFGLLALSKLLFGTFGKGGGCHRCGPGWKHRGRHGNWRKRWEEKMSKMSPEQREKFMSGMNKCGWYDDDCKTGEELKPANEGDSMKQQ